MEIVVKQIYQAYRRCQQGKAKSVSAQKYSANLLDNIFNTHLALHSNAYLPQPYTCFVATNGSKPREVFVADFSDRVVHHYLVPKLEKIINHKFIHHSCANQIGKGTHFAVNTLQKMMRKYYNLDVNTTKVVSPNNIRKSNLSQCPRGSNFSQHLRGSDFSQHLWGSDFSRLISNVNTTKVVSPNNIRGSNFSQPPRGSDFSRLILKSNTIKPAPLKNKNNLKPIHKQNFKKLPHINNINAYQFVTFRTKDSVDDFVKKISNQNINNKTKYQQIDTYLDHSNNGCYLNSQIIDKLKDFFINKKDIYELIALSIMPNHVHILFKQTQDLAKTMQSLKGGSAFIVNKILGKTNALWEKGYYDKGIRDEAQFGLTYDYIKNNAVKANLGDADERFYGVYEEGVNGIDKVKLNTHTTKVVSPGSMQRGNFSQHLRESNFSRLISNTNTTKVVSPNNIRESDFSQPLWESNFSQPPRGSDFSRLISNANTTKVAPPTTKPNSECRHIENYYLQLDIHNFFYSIDKPILLSILAQHFKTAVKRRQIPLQQARDDYKLCVKILQKPQQKNHLNAQQLSKIPVHKQFKNISNNKGLPIGNLTSQFFGNVYMNELDQFVKHQLKVKSYVRFVDDFVLLGSKQQLQSWQTKIEAFLHHKLKLKLKPEQILKPVSSGVDFLGYIIYPHYQLVRKRVINNFYQKLNNWQQQHISHGLINLTQQAVNSLQALVASYTGHFSHAKCFKLMQTKFKQFAVLPCLFVFYKNKYYFKVGNKFATKFTHQWHYFKHHFKHHIVLLQKGKCFTIATDDWAKLTKLLPSVVSNQYGLYESHMRFLNPTLRYLQQSNQAYAFVSEQGYIHNRLKQRKLRLLFTLKYD